MKNRIDQYIDEAFADELLQLSPEPVAEQQLTETVFNRLKLDAPAPRVTKLPVSKPTRRKARILLIAAILVVVSAMGAVAYNEWFKLSGNEVDYYTAQSDAGESTVQNEEKTTSHDTDSPVFFQGMDAAVEKLNTPVGQSVTYQGVTITLDTVAADSNIVNLYFTATYDKPIDFNTVFPDLYPGNSREDGSYPDYSKLRDFMPKFYININNPVDTVNNSLLGCDSMDGYFVDDQTIRFSMLYYLPETYPDQITIYAIAESVYDPSGNQLMGSWEELSSGNPFSFQVSVDKSEENSYCRSASPGEYLFNTKFGEETLFLDKLMLSPLGATMVCTLKEVIGDDDSYNIIGLRPSYLYMVDDKGNVIDFYRDRWVTGIGYYAEELINLSPEAESITIMPLNFSEEKASQSSESHQYHVADIEGQKIETTNLGGYIVQSYTVKDGSIELALEPYGLAIAHYTDFLFDDDNVTFSGDRVGAIREQYNRETGIYTYAVDYYAATKEELEATIETFHVPYNGGYEPNWDEAITLPLEMVTE